MRGVAGEGRHRAGDLRRRRGRVPTVAELTGGLVVPVRHRPGREGKPDVVQALEEHGTHVMGAVFVAHDNGDGDLGVGERPACSSVSESSASRRFRTR